jgi:hypothetical protein
MHAQTNGIDDCRLSAQRPEMVIPLHLQRFVGRERPDNGVYPRLKLCDGEEVALDYAALLHNLQYCAIGHTPSIHRHSDQEPTKINPGARLTTSSVAPYKNINQNLLIAGIDREDVDQRNWLPAHGANQI